MTIETRTTGRIKRAVPQWPLCKNVLIERKKTLSTIAAAEKKKKKFQEHLKKRNHKNILNEMVLPIMSDDILENNRLSSFHFMIELSFIFLQECLNMIKLNNLGDIKVKLRQSLSDL